MPRSGCKNATRKGACSEDAASPVDADGDDGPAGRVIGVVELVARGMRVRLKDGMCDVSDAIGAISDTSPERENQRPSDLLLEKRGTSS